jgi:hypothetical protein
MGCLISLPSDMPDYTASEATLNTIDTPNNITHVRIRVIFPQIDQLDKPLVVTFELDLLEATVNGHRHSFVDCERFR